MPEQVLITSATATEIDLAELWRAHESGPPGWPTVTRATTTLAERVAGVAAEALKAAGADPTPTGIVVGSLNGTGFVVESIHQRLKTKGARWLDPGAFLYFTPHGISATICLRLGLRGFVATLQGPAAGLQAVAHAARRIRTGRSRTVVCGEFEALSPAAADRVSAGTTTGVAAFLVLDAAAEVRCRGTRPLAEVEAVGRDRDTSLWAADIDVLPAEASAITPLHDLVTGLREARADRLTVAATTPGNRYECTVRREAFDAD